MSWNFADIWEAIAETVPESFAQRHGEQAVTWRQFDAIAHRLARCLIDNGLCRQSKVALYLQNSPEYLQAAFGCMKASLVPVNTNYRYQVDELVYLWRNCDAAAVVFHGQYVARVAALRGRCPDVRVWIFVDDGSGPCPEWAVCWAELARQDRPYRRLDVSRSGDDLVLIYTGGTTGRPRGVMWRQHDLYLAANTSGDPESADLGSVRARIQRAASADGARPPVGLPAAPLMHGTAFVFAATILNRGGTLVTLPGNGFDPLQMLDTVSGLRVTDLCFVGDAFCRPIVDALDSHPERWSIDCLLAVSSSGMAWSAGNKERLLDHAPDALLIDFLNSSEASGMGRSLASRRSAPDSGRFKLGERAFVVDEMLRPVAPGSGVVGRIAVRGRVPLGYYKDPGRSAEAFPIIDGERCAVPGDYATVESDGRVRLLGRGSVSINTGGEKVYPDEVEACIKEIPDVVDALVVGIPDERFGERVVALVEYEPGRSPPNAASISDHVGRRLARYKVPRAVCFVDSIGRGPNGKADYPAARRRALEMVGAHGARIEREI
jgi:fatty-acyl-CoA synthase